MSPFVCVIQLFDQSFAIKVPKSRYLPVEATSDLLLLQVITVSALILSFLHMFFGSYICNHCVLVQSDLFTFTDGILTRNTARENLADPIIELGTEFENVKGFWNLVPYFCADVQYSRFIFH